MSSSFAEHLEIERRAQRGGLILPEATAIAEVHTFADGRIGLYPDSLTVRCDSDFIGLTETECKVLESIASRAGKLARMQAIRTEVWAGKGSDEVCANRIKTHMQAIRRKLGRDDLGHVKYGAIQTRRHIGYCALIHMPKRLS